MSYSLFLDDVRYPKHVTWVKLPDVEWKIARSYEEFVSCIKQHGIPVRVAFDHDLSPIHYGLDWSDNTACDLPTGYDCAKWLVNLCSEQNKPLPEYYVHSMNPVGAENIEKCLSTFQNMQKKS
jgi:hypothetical protein